MKKVLALAAIPALLAGAGFGSQWFFAKQLPDSVAQEIQKFNEKNSKFLRFELALAPNQTPEKGKPFTVLLKPLDKTLQTAFAEKDSPIKEGIPFATTVKTGPFFFDNGFEMGKAKIYANLDLNALKLPQDKLETLQKAFANKSPIEITSHTPLTSAGTYKATVNPAKYEETDGPKASFAGLEVNGQNDNIANYTYSGGAWEFTEPNDKLLMRLESIKGEVQSTAANTYKGSQVLGKITIENQAEPFKLTIDDLKIDYNLAEAFIDNFYLGDFDLTLPKVAVTVPQLPNPVEAKLGLNFKANDNNGDFIASVKFNVNDIKNLKMEPFELTNFNYNYSLDKLDSKTISDLMKAIKAQVDNSENRLAAYQTSSQLREKIITLDPEIENALYEETINTTHANPEVGKLLKDYAAIEKQIKDERQQETKLYEQFGVDAYNHLLKPKESTLSFNLNADNSKGKATNTIQLTYMGGLPQITALDELDTKLSTFQPDDIAKILKGDLKFAVDKAVLPAGADMMLSPYIEAGLVKTSDKDFTAQLQLGDGQFNLNGTKVTFAELQQKIMSVNSTQDTSDVSPEMTPEDTNAEMDRIQQQLDDTTDQNSEAATNPESDTEKTVPAGETPSDKSGNSQ